MKKFIIQLEVSAERASKIDQAKIEESCDGEILGVMLKPENRMMTFPRNPAMGVAATVPASRSPLPDPQT